MPRPNNAIAENKSEVAEAIIDAAERLLKTYGYQKMTMTDLAAEAGIGVGTTYLHFASKADVAVAVAERIHSRILNELIELSSTNQSPDILLNELLWLRVKAPYEFVRDKLTNTSWRQLQRHGVEFMADVTSSDPLRLASWKENEAAIFSNAIKAGCDAGIFTPVDPAETAETMLSATCGFMPRFLEEHDFSNPPAFEARVKNVVRLLVTGISKNKFIEK